MIIGGCTVMSRTVDGAPPAVGPPSSTRSSDPAKYATTAPAVVAGSSPAGFALAAVTGGPSVFTRPWAIGWDDTRTPRVPVPSVTSDGTIARAARARVGGTAPRPRGVPVRPATSDGTIARAARTSVSAPGQ